MAEASIARTRGEGPVTKALQNSGTPTAPKVRREAGWKLLEERYDEIEVLREDYVRVPSTRIRGRVYTCQPSRLRCTCPDNALEGNCCKHSQAAKWMAMIAQSGYRIERHRNGRVPIAEWWIFDRETGEPEGVRYSFAEAVMDVVELAKFRGLR